MSNTKHDRDRWVLQFRRGEHLAFQNWADSFAQRIHHLIAMAVKWSHNPDEDLEGLRVATKALASMASDLEGLINKAEWAETLAVSSRQDEANVQLREQAEQEGVE
jgi:hypothetical protein